MSEEVTIGVVHEIVKGTQRRIDTIDKRIDKSNELHEGYRNAVHKRLDRSHSLYNELRANTLEGLNENARKIDGVEQSVKTIDKLVYKVVDEFKGSVNEITVAISKLEKAVELSRNKESFINGMLMFLFKLAVAVSAVVVVLQYVKLK